MAVAPAVADSGTTRRKRNRARKLGPFSRQLGRLDLRTRLGKEAIAFEADLVRHCGGRPTITQQALIRTAVTVWVRIELMRASMMATEELDDLAGRQMLAWINTYRRTLQALGLQATDDPAQELPFAGQHVGPAVAALR